MLFESSPHVDDEFFCWINLALTYGLLETECALPSSRFTADYEKRSHCAYGFHVFGAFVTMPIANWWKPSLHGLVMRSCFKISQVSAKQDKNRRENAGCLRAIERFEPIFNAVLSPEGIGIASEFREAALAA